MSLYIKLWDIAMNVSDAIRLKRAVRKFSDQKLPEATSLAILDAGRHSQSSKNTQPWHFIAITDETILKQLSEYGKWAGHLAGAAMGVALLSEDPAEKFQQIFDLGQAAAYMQLAAWDLGIGSCLATIYDTEKARVLLGFPLELHIRIAISFGYPIDQYAMTNSPQKGGRRLIEEIVHWEKW